MKLFAVVALSSGTASADTQPRLLKTARPPISKTAELAIVTSCVSESLSVPAIARSRVLSDQPLARAVLDRLLVDEGPHARLGFWFLDWAAEQLTDIERAHLACVAADALEVYAPLWIEDCGCNAFDPIGRSDLRRAVDTHIRRPLARYGIAIPITLDGA